MSESGFPQFPAGSRGVTQIPGRGERDGERVRLVGVPGDLREVRMPTRVHGEVVAVKRDGSTRIRTPRGDIEIRVPEGRPRPERGQKVEIEIRPHAAPDYPPEHATLRPAPSSGAPPPETTSPPLQRPTSTPVNIEVRPGTPRAQLYTERTPHPAGFPQPAPSPETGTTLRFQPAAPRILSTLPAPQIINAALGTPSANVFLPLPALTPPPLAEFLTTPLFLLDSQPRHIVQGPAEPLPHPSGQSLKILSVPQPPLDAEPATLQTVPLPSHAIMLPPPALVQTVTGRPVIHSPLESGRQDPFSTARPLRPHLFDGVIERLHKPGASVQSPGTDSRYTPQKTAENLTLQNQKAGSITGTIIGTTPESLPLIAVFPAQSNTAQLFTLQFPGSELTPGTQIQVTPQSPASPPAMQTTALAQGTIAPFALLPSLLTPAPWPLMEEIYQTLAQAAPQAAKNFAAVIPSPANPAQFGSAALFFVAALRSGDLQGWLGEKTVEALRKAGRSSLLSRLTREGGALNRPAGNDPVFQDWRAVSLPLFRDGEIQKIALYYKHEKRGGHSDTEQGKQTRFVFNLTLDNMGKVQLDGLFTAPRLDLIVRTEETFSQAAQADMRHAYADTLRQTQISGELSFQSRPDQWVTIHEEQNGFGVDA